MARVEVSTHIEAEPARVWEVLVDWEGQPRWMVDARSVTVLSPRREGVGVTVRVGMGVGPLVLTDDMVTTEWRSPEDSHPPARQGSAVTGVIGVRHVGWLIRGVGAFELTPTAHGTAFTWWEEIDAPLGPAGEVLTGALVVPVVERVFRRSLANLKRTCETASVRPA